MPKKLECVTCGLQKRLPNYSDMSVRPCRKCKGTDWLIAYAFAKIPFEPDTLTKLAEAQHHNALSDIARAAYRAKDKTPS